MLLAGGVSVAATPASAYAAMLVFHLTLDSCVVEAALAPGHLGPCRLGLVSPRGFSYAHRAVAVVCVWGSPNKAIKLSYPPNACDQSRSTRAPIAARYSSLDPGVIDSYQAVEDFGRTSLCTWNLDHSRFYRPRSMQHFGVPRTLPIAQRIVQPWADLWLSQDLATVPDLHPATVHALKVTPLIKDVPGCVPITLHIFTDGSFFPAVPASDDSDGVESKSAWALLVLAEKSVGDYALVGVASDAISVLPCHADVPSRDVGFTYHSALHSEYMADILAVLFALQHPDTSVSFQVHGDCVGPLMCAKGVQTWSTEPIPHMISSIVMFAQHRIGIEFRHVKGHDWNPWSEAVDALAKFSATTGQPIGRVPQDPVHHDLRVQHNLHWLWTASISGRDRHAWPVLSIDGWCITDYPPAADHVVHPLVPPVQEDKTRVGHVRLKIGSVNVLTLADGPRNQRSLFVTGRLEFLCHQASMLKYCVLGVQESTAKPGSYISGHFVRLVGGGCPSRKRRVEFWLSVDQPYFIDRKHKQCFRKEEATVIADDVGFIIVRIAAAYCSCDFVVGHAPHSSRPASERKLFWSKLSAAVAGRKCSEAFHLFWLLDANADVGSISLLIPLVIVLLGKRMTMVSIFTKP